LKLWSEAFAGSEYVIEQWVQACDKAFLYLIKELDGAVCFSEIVSSPA
jgi:hypothetical protein